MRIDVISFGSWIRPGGIWGLRLVMLMRRSKEAAGAGVDWHVDFLPWLTLSFSVGNRASLLFAVSATVSACLFS
jgi:hypothetical protein